MQPHLFITRKAAILTKQAQARSCFFTGTPNMVYEVAAAKTLRKRLRRCATSRRGHCPVPLQELDDLSKAQSLNELQRRPAGTVLWRCGHRRRSSRGAVLLFHISNFGVVPLSPPMAALRMRPLHGALLVNCLVVFAVGIGLIVLGASALSHARTWQALGQELSPLAGMIVLGSFTMLGSLAGAGCIYKLKRGAMVIFLVVKALVLVVLIGFAVYVGMWAAETGIAPLEASEGAISVGLDSSLSLARAANCSFNLCCLPAYYSQPQAGMKHKGAEDTGRRRRLLRPALRNRRLYGSTSGGGGGSAAAAAAAAEEEEAGGGGGVGGGAAGNMVSFTGGRCQEHANCGTTKHHIGACCVPATCSVQQQKMPAVNIDLTESTSTCVGSRRVLLAVVVGISEFVAFGCGLLH